MSEISDFRRIIYDPMQEDYQELIGKHARAMTKIEKYEKALQYYAEDITWTDGEGGNVAAKALEEVRSE